MNNYKELKIWQNGVEIVSTIFDLTKRISDEDVFTIRPQIIRSSISIPSNIAEDIGRGSQKELKDILKLLLVLVLNLKHRYLLQRKMI